MRGLTLILALLAAPAMADQSWSTFFDAPGAEVERSEDGARETVTLQGDVVLFREKDGDAWTYTGLDRSAHGAVGCMSRILNEIKLVSSQCEGVLPDGGKARLDTHLSRIAAFYGDNAVPQMSAADYQANLDAYITARGPLQCTAVTEDFKTFAGQVTNDASTAIIDDLLSVPRLPVTNPCL